jgi:hypothetical protein
MGQILKDQKEQNRKISYEDISSDLENNPSMMYEIDIEPSEEINIIPVLIDYIKNMLDDNELTDNEYKLGLALVEIFENYPVIFPATDNNKFNKNVILLSLRDMTNMSTKEIRSSMKKFKKIYDGMSGLE